MRKRDTKGIFRFVLGLLLSMIGTHSHGQNVTYNNVRIGLDAPSLGVNVLTNWPTINSGWVRGFSISNQNDSDRFIYFGAFGNVLDGISKINYSFIGKTYTNPYMTFLPNGNVGIGTVSPNVKLAVNGLIRAREIKVEITNWPDYVFGPGYRRMPLEEVELFILEHGHLPEIPSASKVEKNGLSVGEMNVLLLKKIEELTLEVIENRQLINLQNQRIDRLEKNK